MKRKYLIPLIFGAITLPAALYVISRHYAKEKVLYTLEAQTAVPVPKAPTIISSSDNQPIIQIDAQPLDDKSLLDFMKREEAIIAHKMDDIVSAEQMRLNQWKNLDYHTTVEINGGWQQLISKIPIETHTDIISDRDIDCARNKVALLIRAYSQSDYNSYLEARGGEGALALTDDSDYARNCYDRMLEIIAGVNQSDATSIKSLLAAHKYMWDLQYSTIPFMNKVSFENAFISFKKYGADKFYPEKWSETIHGMPNALQDESIARGSLSEDNCHNVLPNKISPVDVFNRDGEIKFFDISFTPAHDNLTPFPVMFRFYYESAADTWLLAFISRFYNRPVDNEPFRPLM